MNQTMTDKPAPRTTLPPSAAQPELSENDALMERLRPYLTQVGIFVAVALLGLIAVTLFVNSRMQAGSLPWEELSSAQSEFAISRNVDRLEQVAAAHPNTAAAMWALQSAGDYQLRLGIDKLASDREAGFESIKKSQECFQQVLDAPASAKTPDIQQASVFAMAYASESLGQFDDAAKYYAQLIEQAPESHFISAAERGVARSTNPEFVAAYKAFQEYEEIGDAPGPNVPDRPEIDFPEFELPKGQTPAQSDDATEADDQEETELTQPEVKAAEPAATDEPAADSEETTEPAQTSESTTAPAQEEAAETASEAAAEKVNEAAQEAAAQTADAVEATATNAEPAVEGTVEQPAATK